jgi:O-antigen ligase
MKGLPVAYERALAVVLALHFLVTPLYPGLIGLTPIVPPGVSLLDQRGAALLLLFAFALALVIALAAVRVPGENPPTTGPLIAYLAATLVATVAGFEPAVGLLFALLLVMTIAVHVVIARFYRSPLISGGIYAAFLAGGIAASALALGMVLTRRPPALFTVGHGRAIGTFIVPGELAGYLLLLVPTAIGVTLATRRPWLRALALPAAAVGLVALFATFSRAGWIGALAGALFAAYALRPKAAPALTACALLVVILVFGFDMHHNPSENFTRLSIWRTGARTAQLFPLTGVGPGGFRLVYPALRPPDGEPAAFHAHNFLLTTFAEMGLAGVVTLLAVWWRFAAALREALRRAQPQARTFALLLSAGCVATLVQSLLDVVQIVALGLWIPFMALTLGAARHGLPEAR